MPEQDLSTSDLFSLRGRTAIITGASRGLGRVIAEGFADAGASVCLIARGADDVRRAAGEIATSGSHRVFAFAADVSSADDVARAIAQAHRELGRIDILVNVAGTIARGGIAETEASEFARVMRVNAEGTWLMCRAVVPMMKAAGGGAIINVASALGLVGATDRSAYAASKGAVVQITRSLAAELAPHSIRVNAIAPGPFATDMTQDLQKGERWERLLGHRVPMRRMASVREIRGPVLFLASPAASFVTGVVLPVDGGWTAS